jgi:ribosomal protein L37AE/L43A
MSTLLAVFPDGVGGLRFELRINPLPRYTLADCDTVGPHLRRPGWDGVSCPSCKRTDWMKGLGLWWTCPSCGEVFEVAAVAGFVDCDGVSVEWSL